MDNKLITNETELRSATILLNAHSLAMCNETTQEKIVERFCEAKDLLIAIYQYNIQRIVDSNN